MPTAQCSSFVTPGVRSQSDLPGRRSAWEVHAVQRPLMESALPGCLLAPPPRQGQPMTIPSAEPEDTGSGSRIIRNELNNPTSPARIGMSSAT